VFISHRQLIGKDVESWRHRSFSCHRIRQYDVIA